MDRIFDLLTSRCDEAGFTQADRIDVDRWADERGLNMNNFLDLISVEIAKRYQRHELSFQFCDSLVNDLWSVFIGSVSTDKFRIPAIFLEVYEAFDAGEFHRLADGSDDPVSTFTDPLIAAIVSRLG